jgi:hypothetical protein
MNRVQRDLSRCVRLPVSTDVAIAWRAAARIRTSVELGGSSTD